MAPLNELIFSKSQNRLENPSSLMPIFPGPEKRRVSAGYPRNDWTDRSTSCKSSSENSGVCRTSTNVYRI